MSQLDWFCTKANREWYATDSSCDGRVWFIKNHLEGDGYQTGCILPAEGIEASHFHDNKPIYSLDEAKRLCEESREKSREPAVTESPFGDDDEEGCEKKPHGLVLPEIDFSEYEELWYIRAKHESAVTYRVRIAATDWERIKADEVAEHECGSLILRRKGRQVASFPQWQCWVCEEGGEE